MKDEQSIRDAVKRGSSTYFGTPCSKSNDHVTTIGDGLDYVSSRYVLNGCCVSCTRAASIRSQAKRRASMRDAMQTARKAADL